MLSGSPLAATTFELSTIAYNVLMIVKVLIGFSIIIFVHELGHFMAAKYVGVRVDRFAIGFGYRLVGWRRGEGVAFGHRPNYTPDELKQRGYGETDYCFKALPFGGYVKMLGQDDIQIDEKSGEITMTDDPRAFTNRSVGQRMLVVSAGVVMNLIFGALAYMTVFLIGKEMPAPVIGLVAPDSPAEQAGLMSGDKVTSIDGKPVNTFIDLLLAPILADGDLVLQVERDGKPFPKPFRVTPVMNQERQLRMIGILPLMTAELTADGDAVPKSDNLKAGDRVVTVDGTPIENAHDIDARVLLSHGGSMEVVAERRDPKHSNAPPERIVSKQRVRLDILPAAAPGAPDRGADRRHLLGIIPLSQVRSIVAGGAAEKAGFKLDDVVLVWDGVPNPVFSEIIDSIRSKPDKDVAVTVLREGKPLDLTVRPKRPFRFFTDEQAMVGLSFELPDLGPPIVANVAPDTPAASLNMPRGAQIESVAGEPVKNWFDVVEALRANAGRDVPIEFRVGNHGVSGTLAVPSSLVNELNLPRDAVVVSIAGKDRVPAPPAEGQKTEDRYVRLPSTYAIRELLRENVGKSVKVEYRRLSDTTLVQADFQVRENNIDPWQMRLLQQYDVYSRFKTMTHVVDADGNPIKAMWMGLDYTWTKLVEVYVTIKHLSVGNVGMQNVQGPVGIISRAVTIAKEGFVELLFFLAYLSISLAVINFLPLPVVDGGLMVFLLIEKIKGKPLSIKTQMVSTIVGLALIVLCFLFVTFQDIARLISGDS
jgi:regulator of sigma E protease